MPLLNAIRSGCRSGEWMHRLAIALLLSIMILVLPGSALSGGDPQADRRALIDPRRVAWKHLGYRAKNWKVDISVDIALSRLPSDQAEAGLLEAGQGVPVRSSGAEAMLITLDMMLDAALRDPVHVTNKVWFDPQDAAALGRFRLRRGEDDFEKTYRFTRQGVFRRNLEPQGKAEARRDPDQWSRKRSNFYAFDRERLGCPVVSERLLLIYLVSALERITTDSPFAVCVFGKRQLHRVTLSPGGEAKLVVDFREKRPGAEVQRTGAVKTRRIKLTTEPLASDLDAPENFSFLGMHEDIVIHVDPDAYLPLQVNGRIKKFGAAELKLTQATRQ